MCRAQERWPSIVGSQYARREMGKKRTAVVVAHDIAGRLAPAQRRGYKESGGDHYDRLHGERTRNNLVTRLEKLGYEVELKPNRAAP